MMMSLYKYWLEISRQQHLWFDIIGVIPIIMITCFFLPKILLTVNDHEWTQFLDMATAVMKLCQFRVIENIEENSEWTSILTKPNWDWRLNRNKTWQGQNTTYKDVVFAISNASFQLESEHH